jgi:uncharacterized membrane protein
MEATYDRQPVTPIHPLHAILLAFPPPLFVGALLTDLAYHRTFQVQWVNFSSWLITGGLLVGACTLLWALVGYLAGGAGRNGRPLTYLLALLAMWVLGLVNAFQHGKDAYASMPAGLYLSAIVAALALVAAWTGYSGFARGRVP